MSGVSFCALLGNSIEAHLLNIQTTGFVILTQLLNHLLHDLAVPLFGFLSKQVDVSLIDVGEIVLHI